MMIKLFSGKLQKGGGHNENMYNTALNPQLQLVIASNSLSENVW